MRYMGVILVVCATVGRALAATYDVDRTDDTVAASACTAADNDCSLRGAIISANANPGADVINLPEGTYTLSLAGAGEDDAATGDLDIRDDLTILGKGAATTIIDGGGIDRVIHSDPAGTGIVVAIQDVTIQHGATTVISFVLANGGAVRNGTPFTSLVNSGGTLTLTDCVVQTSSTERDGGGIGNSGTLTLIHSLVTGNSAASNGGGITQEDTGSLTIIDSTIEGNQAGQGGGLFMGYFSIGAAPVVTITGSTVSGNNSAGTGGIFYNRGTFTLTNSTVSTNQDVGIRIAWTAGTLRSCTIVDNVSTGVSGPATIANTILAGNHGGSSDCDGSPTSAGYNLIQNATGCGLGGDATGNVLGQDPQLGPLTDNDGPTQTHAIPLGSPALDAGNPAEPGSGDFACETTDQRGIDRPEPLGGRCDIGAFELVYAPPITTTSTTVTTVTTTVTTITTTTVIGSTSTSTTVPEGPCGGIPLSPPSFASIDCRLALLLEQVNDAPELGTYQAKLVKNVTKAQQRMTDGGTLCGQSNLKKTRKRLQQAAKVMSKLVHRLNGKAARTKLDATLRQTFVDAGTQVQTDVTTFRNTVACPQDAPS